MPRQRLPPVLFSVLALTVAACDRLPGGKSEDDGPVAARVGSHKITLAELRGRLADAPPAYQQYAAAPEGRRQFLDLLIREKILLNEAQKLEIERDESFRKAVERYKEQWERRLREYQETLLVESALRRLRSKELAVTDSDVEKYYNAHRAEYEKPVAVSVSHILLSTEAEAQAALARLKKREPFEKLARELSRDPLTGARGGKIDPFRRGSLVPEFENAAFRLKKGQISGVVKTQFGFHIIKKAGQTPLPPRTLAEAKEEIRSKLEREKFDQWVATQQSLLGVSVDENVMAQLNQEPPKK